LRDDYAHFQRRGAEIVAIGPDDWHAFRLYWQTHGIPFVGLSDADHTVARRYQQEVRLFRLGRMPLVCVVDADGFIRYAHYGASMADIPSNETLCDVIDRLNPSSEAM